MASLEDLETRLKSVEDRLEITQLFLTHPLAIDAGEGEFWMSHWTEDSIFDRTFDPDKHSGSYQGSYGKPTMIEEINSPELEALRQGGLMHVNTSPSILIDGNVASATNYTQIITVEDGGYRTRRIVANRWELRREAGRWMITKRVSRPMGHKDTRGVMRSGLDLRSTG